MYALGLSREEEHVNMCNAKDFWTREGEKKGEKIGIQKGIEAVISILQRKNTPIEEMITDLQEQFRLSHREALRQVRKALA